MKRTTRIPPVKTAVRFTHPTRFLHQLPRIAPRPGELARGVRVADDLFFHRVPRDLALRADRDFRDVADSVGVDRIVDVAHGRLAGSDRLDEVGPLVPTVDQVWS